MKIRQWKLRYKSLKNTTNLTQILKLLIVHKTQEKLLNIMFPFRT